MRCAITAKIQSTLRFTLLIKRNVMADLEAAPIRPMTEGGGDARASGKNRARRARQGRSRPFIPEMRGLAASLGHSFTIMRYRGRRVFVFLIEEAS